MAGWVVAVDRLAVSEHRIRPLLTKNRRRSAVYRNCLSHVIAFCSSVKCFIGIGGGWSLNKRFIMSLASPGSEIIAIAVYTCGNCSVENLRVSLSGTGELLR